MLLTLRAARRAVDDEEGASTNVGAFTGAMAQGALLAHAATAG